MARGGKYFSKEVEIARKCDQKMDKKKLVLVIV